MFHDADPGQSQWPQGAGLVASISSVIADALALSDEDGRVLAVNRAYERLYGYAEVELVGHSFARIFPEERRAWAESAYRETFRLGGPSVHRTTVCRADGTDCRVESRITFVRRDGGRVAMLSVIHPLSDSDDHSITSVLRPVLEIDRLHQLHDLYARDAIAFAGRALDGAMANQVVENALLATWRLGAAEAGHSCDIDRLFLQRLQGSLPTPLSAAIR